MTTPSPVQHPLDVLDSLAADVLSDTETAGQFLANDFAAVLNRAAGRQVATPDAVLTFARTPLEFEPGPDIEIPPDTSSRRTCARRPGRPRPPGEVMQVGSNGCVTT